MLTHTVSISQKIGSTPLEQSGISFENNSIEIPTELPLVIELSFEVNGQAIPLDHGYTLFSALVHLQAELHNLEGLSIQTITSTTFKNGKLLLTNYSKLRLRLPVDKVPLVYPLAGRSIVIGGDKLRLGIPRIDLLRPAKNLYSRMVVIKGHEQPETFLEAVQYQLKRLGIEGETRVSIGSNGLLNRKTVKVREYTVVGFGLEVTNLSNEDSIKLQSYGIGGKRRMGCGIFVPKNLFDKPSKSPTCEGL